MSDPLEDALAAALKAGTLDETDVESVRDSAKGVSNYTLRKPIADTVAALKTPGLFKQNRMAVLDKVVEMTGEQIENKKRIGEGLEPIAAELKAEFEDQAMFAERKALAAAAAAAATARTHKKGAGRRRRVTRVTRRKKLTKATRRRRQ